MEHSIKDYSLTGTGNAELFYDLYLRQLCCNVTRKKWYFFDTKVWQEDKRGVARRKADEMLKEKCIKGSTDGRSRYYLNMKIKYSAREELRLYSKDYSV